MHTNSNVKKSELGSLLGLENDWSIVERHKKQNWLVSRVSTVRLGKIMRIIVTIISPFFVYTIFA